MPFELQGHRGARGLKPENTLPSFEAALDIGVSTIEADLHLTRDGVPILCHDPGLTDALVTLQPGQKAPTSRWLSQMTLAEARRFRVDRNPDPRRFPQQCARVTPVAELFSAAEGMAAYALPTLADFFHFADAYAGPLGEQAGKTPSQRQRARRLRFDLELKRVPFEPASIGDTFDGTNPGTLERRVVEEVQRAGVTTRTIVRSFDHRSLRALGQLEPRLTTAVLIATTAPVAPELLTREAGATIYCPDFRFIDEPMVRRLQAAGLRIIPWTVNRCEDWQRLVAWGVDGVTTDFPDQLARWLNDRAIAIL